LEFLPNERWPKVMCLKCGHCVANWKVTKMKRHLARCHPLQFDIYQQLVKEACTAIPLALAVPAELRFDERPEVEHTGYLEKVSSDYITILSNFCAKYF
jgi:hypothetical protein